MPFPNGMKNASSYQPDSDPNMRNAKGQFLKFEAHLLLGSNGETLNLCISAFPFTP